MDHDLAKNSCVLTNSDCYTSGVHSRWCEAVRDGRATETSNNGDHFTLENVNAVGVSWTPESPLFVLLLAYG
jgi:hypothetical protein